MRASVARLIKWRDAGLVARPRIGPTSARRRSSSYASPSSPSTSTYAVDMLDTLVDDSLGDSSPSSDEASLESLLLLLLLSNPPLAP